MKKITTLFCILILLVGCNKTSTQTEAKIDTEAETKTEITKADAGNISLADLKNPALNELTDNQYELMIKVADLMMNGLEVKGDKVIVNVTKEDFMKLGFSEEESVQAIREANDEWVDPAKNPFYDPNGPDLETIIKNLKEDWADRKAQMQNAR